MRAPGPFVKGLSLFAMIAIWGTTWSVIRVGLVYVPPLTGVAARFAVAALVLAFVAAALRLPLGRERREWWLWVVHGLLSFCASYSVTYWAEQWVPSGLTAVLFATFPLFVAVLAHLWLPGERLGALAFVGVALGFGGVAVIFSEDFALLGGAQVAFAAAVMLLSPLAAAVANVVVKRWGSGVHPVSLNLGGMTLTVVVVGVLAAGLERGRPLVLTPVAVASVLYLAVFGSALTFVLYYWLLDHMEATRLSLIAYAIPVVAVAVGAAAFDEPVTLRTLAGTALVIGGVALASRRPAPRPLRASGPAQE